MKSFIFSLLLASIFCFDGIITPPPEILTKETAKCFLNANVTFLISRIYFELGKVDDNGVQNLRTALAEGFMRVYPYVYPSMYTGPKDQVKDVVEALKGIKVQCIFIDINIKSWREFKNMNIQALRDLINAYKAAGFQIGIIGTRHMWEQAFGSWELGNYPLIYESLDGKRDFNDFRPFGGFKEPAGKHYSDKELCGYKVQMVYMPKLIC